MSGRHRHRARLPAGNQILPPIRVYVDPRFDPAAPGVDECMALTTTHEMGHSLGIFAHSPNADDIMFADPVVSDAQPPRPGDRRAGLPYRADPNRRSTVRLHDGAEAVDTLSA